MHAGADPASKFFLGGGDFSNIWQSSLITSSLLYATWSIRHHTAVTMQWTSKWPYIAKVVVRIVQNHGEKVTFACFRGERSPPWIRPLYAWREQLIKEWSRRVISILTCCHSVKLCALVVRAFWSQHCSQVLLSRK